MLEGEPQEPMPHARTCSTCARRWDRAVAVHEALRTRPRDGALPGEIPYGALLTPIGLLWIAAGDGGVVAVDSTADELAFSLAVERLGRGVPRYDPERLREPMAQFLHYFRGLRRSFDLSVDLRGLSVTQRSVLEAVGRVPWGEVRSYGDVAREIGKPRAARVVGTAVATSPVSIVTPCHRIIRSDGTAGEYGSRTLGACGAHIKHWLLALEGVRVEGGRV